MFEDRHDVVASSSENLDGVVVQGDRVLHRVRVPGEKTHHPFLPANIKSTYRVPGKKTHHPFLPANIKTIQGARRKKRTTPSFLQISNPKGATLLTRTELPVFCYAL